MSADHWCRHYTGVQNLTCKAGVAYKDVRDQSRRPWRWPCTEESIRERCPQFEAQTEEELTQLKRDRAQRLNAVGIMRASISKQTGDRGTVVCAVCGNLARWTRAPNGRVACACPTGCISWME